MDPSNRAPEERAHPILLNEQTRDSSTRNARKQTGRKGKGGTGAKRKGGGEEEEGEGGRREERYRATVTERRPGERAAPRTSEAIHRNGN